ncbi:hypothetical protein Pan44_42610 [Caulifigura coniformis]|uniref:AsmA-like C-terminal domain-containing protein n=1 Tax=Caulifigura coniformis TaxID=2527983 RepID=A0A517SJB3_9PLAN|nr:hypothetical protein [Caulifigura coniformis]QDT56209.1 hypothetical protein Pan44_42610 [Caulifigura coniformis]
MTTAEVENNVETAPPPRRKRRRVWPLILILLVAAVYAAPWLLSINGVAQQVTATALPWLPPGSNIGKPSLGWMSPVHLAGLRFLDDHGRVLLECEHVTSQKSLWEMATSPGSPGGWVLENPRAYLYVDPAGCSINPVIRAFLARQKNTRPLNFDIAIERGLIEVRDTESKPLATISEVAARYLNSAQSRSLEARGELTDGVQRETIDLRGQWAASDSRSTLPPADFHAAVSYLPLTLFEPWLQANSTIAHVAGGGELLVELASTPAEGAGAVSAKATFKPRDAVYRRTSDQVSSPVPTGGIGIGGQWDAQADRLTFDNLSATAGAITVSGSGHIEQPRDAGIVEIRATADQDLTGILDLLNPQVRSHIAVKGLRVRNVAVTGALWPDRFQARSSGEPPPPPATLAGDITWSEAMIYGIRATPGAVTAAFQPSGLALWPRDVRVGDGQLMTLPEIHLVENRQLVAPAGPMLVDVNLTPEMCREWLRFVSPILADATAVDGKITLIIESGQMPFAKPDAAEIAGIVRVHSANVTPGPMARQAVDSAATLARLITRKDPAWADDDLRIALPPQDIAFRMQGGRVYHNRLTFQAGDVVVTTRGSVGIDHTLDMQVEFPLPDAWLQGGPVQKSLRNELVQIPIRGTLERPQVDGRAVADWGTRIGAGAAGGLLQNLLEKGLDRAAEKAQRRREIRDAP